ncbi:MAG: hypothetical protein WDZ85_00595 [Candidatus Paceibacterota bacterium]
MNLNKTFVVIGVLVFLASALLVYNNGRGPEAGEVISSPDQVDIHYFLSRTCPYCRNQNLFWEEFLLRYPEVVLHKYYVEDRATASVFSQLASKYGIERYAGTVPITFIGEEYFIGFDNPDGVGRAIEEAVMAELSKLKVDQSSSLPVNDPAVKDADEADEIIAN